MPAPFTYRAFGLTIASDVALPELQPGGGAADVTIARVAALPPPSPGLVRMTDRAAADATGFRFDAQGAALFHAANGCRIDLVIPPEPDMAAIRAHLLGSAMGALLHQRGILPLHAGAIDIGGRAIAVTGMSGAGKSTFALGLQQRGHAVLGDDLCAVAFAGGIAVTSPAVTRLKLWRQSLEAAGHSADGLEAIAAREDKYHWPAAAMVPDRAVPLAAVVLLDWSDDDAVSVTQLRGAEAVAALVVNTFRGVLVEAMGAGAAHLSRCTQAARSAAVLRLRRPRDFARADAAADALIAALG